MPRTILCGTTRRPMSILRMSCPTLPSNVGSLFSNTRIDVPAGRPSLGRMDPDEDGEASAEDGRLSQLTLRLVPFNEEAIQYEGHFVPKIPPPTEMIVANDVKDGGQMPNLTEKETIACLLNAYNVRHYVHKRAQVSSKGGLFVIAIEYDVRQSGERMRYGENLSTRRR